MLPAKHDSQDAKLDELVALLQPTEESILWVGAGVSIPAGFASAAELVKELHEAAKPDGGLPDCDDYLEATDAFIQLAGEGRLYDLLQSKYGKVAKPTVAHRALARLVKAGCFRTVITTNYDNLLERALDDEGVAYLTQVREDNISVLEGGAVRLLKPHGDRGNWSKVVLSGGSYREFGEESKDLAPQLDSLLKKYPVFFVGYSMLDPRTLGWLTELTEPQRSKGTRACIQIAASSSFGRFIGWSRIRPPVGPRASHRRRAPDSSERTRESYEATRALLGRRKIRS